MTTPIDNGDDVIDSRDVTARIKELEDRMSCDNCGQPAREVDDDSGDIVHDDDKRECDPVLLISPEIGAAVAELADPLDEDEAIELAALRDLASNGEGLGTGVWRDGATLVRDSYFEEYAEELASDIGAIPDDAAWPARHIDWEAAANELKMDYTSIDFGGVDYWARA